MAGRATIECYGAVPEGYVPFVCGPFFGLGNGRPHHAPTLAPIGPQHWRVQVVLPEATHRVDCTDWLTGLRSTQQDALKVGAGFRAAPIEVEWHYEVTTAPRPTVELFYYSGWPNVDVEIDVAGESLSLPMASVGPGRTPGETLWGARLPLQAGMPWGFLLSGPAAQYDRPPNGGLYRPCGSCLYLADGELFTAPPPPRRSAPRVETLRFPAPEMGHTFVVHVALPRDYDARPEADYPLVFLNDGQNQLAGSGLHGGWHSDTTLARLTREGRVREAVLVAVEMHPDRNRAFFPPGDQKALHGQGPTYTDLLAGPLSELLRSRYRLRRGPEQTAIIGSSNGAIHALSAGLARPDAFGLLGCLSYAVMNPERNTAAIEQAATLPFQRMYLDSGTRWGAYDDEEQSHDYTLNTFRLRQLLVQKGAVIEEQLRYRLAYGDAHNELAWRRRFAGCIEFLLPPD